MFFGLVKIKIYSEENEERSALEISEKKKLEPLIKVN